VNRTHTTEPSESGTAHLWEVGDTRGSATLSALHCRDQALVGLIADVPSLASRATPTDSGFWVFDVVQSHEPGSVGWAPCPRHGACDMDAIVSQIAEPMWARLTAAGVTDGAVYAELERLLAAVQEEAA
jgi:hypothetical protein